MLLVWSRQPYATSYAGARVLDIGAHKGYYGAYVLARGAQAVRSYEPESRNFDALELATASFRGRGADWTVERAAVAAQPGAGQLVVSRTSSSTHSLVAQSRTAEDSAEREAVSVVTAERALREVVAGGSQRVIVKVDAEGAECDILLGTPADLWRSVDEIFVEVHGFASCTAEDIISHLAAAGLVLRRQVPAGPHAELHFARAD